MQRTKCRGRHEIVAAEEGNKDHILKGPGSLCHGHDQQHSRGKQQWPLHPHERSERRRVVILGSRGAEQGRLLGGVMAKETMEFNVVRIQEAIGMGQRVMKYDENRRRA
jgi:hypothetical protein